MKLSTCGPNSTGVLLAVGQYNYPIKPPSTWFWRDAPLEVPVEGKKVKVSRIMSSVTLVHGMTANALGSSVPVCRNCKHEFIDSIMYPPPQVSPALWLQLVACLVCNMRAEYHEAADPVPLFGRVGQPIDAPLSNAPCGVEECLAKWSNYTMEAVSKLMEVRKRWRETRHKYGYIHQNYCQFMLPAEYHYEPTDVDGNVGNLLYDDDSSVPHAAAVAEDADVEMHEAGRDVSHATATGVVMADARAPPVFLSSAGVTVTASGTSSGARESTTHPAVSSNVMDDPELPAEVMELYLRSSDKVRPYVYALVAGGARDIKNIAMYLPLDDSDSDMDDE